LDRDFQIFDVFQAFPELRRETHNDRKVPVAAFVPGNA